MVLVFFSGTETRWFEIKQMLIKKDPQTKVENSFQADQFEIWGLEKKFLGSHHLEVFFAVSKSVSKWLLRMAAATET